MPKISMYFLVLYNLSPIQQWIQAGHAAVEYILKFHKENFIEKDRTKILWLWTVLREWMWNHKTFIILNWWTTFTMENHIKYLEHIEVPYATFEEPDLWWITTAIAFLWNSEDPNIKYFTNNFKLA